MTTDLPPPDGSWPEADPLLVELPVHRPPRRWVLRWRAGNGLVWLGGGDWREMGDRSERSDYQMGGSFVVVNALVAGTVMALAAAGVGAEPLLAVPIVLLWALFIGIFDRAISAKIIDPDVPAWRGRAGFVVRAVFTVVLGVMIAETAALSIFAPSIQRTLDDNIQEQIDRSQNAVNGAAGEPTSRQRQLEELVRRRTELDTAVTTAQQELVTATTRAACERNPGPQCAGVPVTGDAGTGPESRERDRQEAEARAASTRAQTALTEQAPDLDTAIADLRRNIDEARRIAEQNARSETGVDARWAAMHEYTFASAAALSLRLGLAAALIFLDMVPLLLKVLRGQSGHDRRVLAARRRDTRALQEHTGRYQARLSHASSEHQSTIAQQQQVAELDRAAALAGASARTRVDTQIADAQQQRRLTDALAAIEHAEPVVDPADGPRRAAPAAPAESDLAPPPAGALAPTQPEPEGSVAEPVLIPAPGRADHIPDWWSAQDRSLIGRQFGPYLAVAPLSGADRGGFGRMLVGRDTRDHTHDVVIKAVSEATVLDEGVRRLRRRSAARRMWDAEVDAARHLQSHAAIAEVLSYGHDHGYLWIASPLYAPGSLVRWVQAQDGQGMLTLEDTFIMMRQVVDALKFAHVKGLTHGDLKPHNIVLHGIRVRLVDWGLARVIGASAETSGHRPRGTRFYTAPEVFLNGTHGDQLADLYATGATWYYLLTGMAPAADVVEEYSPRPGAAEVAAAVAHGELAPTPLTRLLPGLPRELAALVHRLLSPEPLDRSPNGTCSSAATELAEIILELERGLTTAQRHLPVGDHAIDNLERAGAPRRTALPEPRPTAQLATTRPDEDEPVETHLADATRNGDSAATVEDDNVLPMQRSPLRNGAHIGDATQEEPSST